MACVCCAVVPLVAYAGFTYARTARALRSQEDTRFVEREVAVGRALDDLTTAELGAIGSYAQWDRFGAALQRGDSTWLRGQMDSLAGPPGAVAQVFSPDGKLLVASGSSVAGSLWGTSEAGHVVSFGQDAAAAGFETLNGQLALVSAQFVSRPEHSGRHLGLLVVARPVDASVLADVEAATGVRLSVAGGGAAAAAGGGASGGAASGVLNQVGRPFDRGHYRDVYLAVYNIDGYRAGLVRMAMDRSATLATTADLRTMAAVALALALVASIGAALLLSRRISGPLYRLASAAVAIAGGETRQTIEVHGIDEIGLLARAFNTMSERVTERVTDLSEKLASLSGEMTGLNVVFGETLVDSVDLDAELGSMLPHIAAIVKADAAGLYGGGDGEVRQAPAAQAVAAANGSKDGSGVSNCTSPAAAELAARVAAGEPFAQGPAAGDDSDRLAAAPVVHGDVRGALVVARRGPRSYDEQERALLTMLAGQIAVAVGNAATFRRLEAGYLTTVAALAGAIEVTDDYPPEHPKAVADVCELLAERLELAEADRRLLRYGAVLHDVGKIGVPERILRKPARLSDTEFSVMANHTVIGESIVARIDYLRPVAPVIRAAHERWDGAGYPDGLAGAEIPLASRVVFVADAYVAMTSDRPYRTALPHAAALEAVAERAGTCFEPDVAAALVEAGDALVAAAHGGPRREPAADRVLATVLFVDIVESTARAAEIGDAAWQEELRRFYALVGDALKEYRGTLIDTAGDAVFARFDGAARAVRCARAIGEALAPLGLRIRAGCHSGEIELMDGEVRGLAVHIGARVAALAAPGEVLVSSTVRDLVAGSGLTFSDRGEHDLKGVPGRCRVYAAVE